ncbi:MAG: hypothetical protein NVS4B8_09960 [Herpetosiphon sp.]
MNWNQPLRWLLDSIVAAFEATRIYVVLLLIQSEFSGTLPGWIAILTTIVLGGLASPLWSFGSRIARLGQIALAVSIAVGITTLQLANGLFPWQTRQPGAAFDWIWAYVLLLTMLWAWYRGLNIRNQDHASLVQSLRRTVLILSITGFLVALVGGLPVEAASTQRLIVSVIALVALGLLSLIGARTLEQGAAWRSVRSGVFLTAWIIVLGIGGLALASDQAAWLLRLVLLVAVVVSLVVMAPLLWLVSPLVRFLSTLRFAPNRVPQIVQTQESVQDRVLGPVATTLLHIPLFVIALLPALGLLVALLLFTRRRSSNPQIVDETRESLLLWSSVARDLHLLFPRPRRADDLALALQALRGADPATRVRRRYIQALVLAAQRGHHRPRWATPFEFGPSLQVALFDSAATSTLTACYQRARYAPSSVSTGDAEASDAAWYTCTHPMETRE